MKSYLFAVFLLTICVVFVESAPTQNDESPTYEVSTLVRDLGVTPKQRDQCSFNGRIKECFSAYEIEGEFTKCCLVETDGISLLIFVIAPGKVF